MENPIKMDDLGGTTILGNIHIYVYYIHLSGYPQFLQSPILETGW